MDPSQTSGAGRRQQTFFGHPRGLSTLFFTEMWERFSYYGMRALLVLFMIDTARGGMGMGKAEAGAVYGLYTFAVYALALPGGWVADRLIGQRRAVLVGGIIIAAGHYALAVPAELTFYVGLGLVALGTGLLKPNVSAIVGDLYKGNDARRDAGFSIFYMGINVGAFLGPGICSFLGEKVDWHLGFGAAGVGMTFAVLQYVLGRRHLAGAGELKGDAAGLQAQARSRSQFLKGLGVVAAAALVFAALTSAGVMTLTVEAVARTVSLSISVLAVLYFSYVILFACRDGLERRRVGLIFVLFIGAAIFWSGFEQAGSSMNLFAKEHTDLMIFSWEFPAGWLQQVNPLLIVMLAPLMGMLWVGLGSRSPSLGVKFAFALTLLGAGFFVMAWGSQYVAAGKVSPVWLVTTYFFHTVGELCLSPVGLSSITKLS
ncbi:MAG: peptide MFS transporter, partial [Candidatus Aminicenantes bacterium]|nr:peptide MFS transporter [Candidatus Aminicenantes bacterium]